MVTLDSVAAAAGVSRDTVSRVLNGKTKEVWPTVIRRAARIRRIATEMGYRPHAAARAMSEGRFGTVALLLSTEAGRSTLPMTMLDGIHDALSRRGMNLMIAKLPDKKLTSEGFVPKVLREWMADGLLINYNRTIPERMIDLIEGHHVPAVWINCKRDADCVYPDDFGGGRTATEYLLKLGHRDIAYMEFSAGELELRHYSEADRRAGYEEAMREAGLATRLFAPGADDGGAAELDLALRWLSRPRRPTAVVAYSHGAAVQHAAALTGLRVPADLSVVSFGEKSTRPLGRPETVALVPAGAVGERAVEMLLVKLKAPHEPLGPAVVAESLAEGATAAGPGEVETGSQPRGTRTRAR
jgi:DNA-binding LacI/PurR family transcriptional regulator